MNLGFVGAGSMAAAMARGWAGSPDPPAMSFFDIAPERSKELADEVGGAVADGLPSLAAEADWVVLSVKPAALDDVANGLGGEAPALLSVLAATPLERIEGAFPGVPAVRLMPNQPVEVRRGMLCYAVRDDLGERAAPIIALLGSLGKVMRLPDEQIDAATAVMSCSPAYVALLSDALIDAGIEEGLEVKIAAQLVGEAVAGTAELLLEREPAEVRSRVAPPGGATEAGLEALDQAGFEAAIHAAVRASLERFR